MKPAVLVVGDIITDIAVQLREPVIWGTDTRSAVGIRSGGSAANAAAWMAVAGAIVEFVGKVGDDVFAAFHRQELKRVGVEPHLLVDAVLPTGSIVVLVNTDGERTMLTDRGANLNLQPVDLPAALFSAKGSLYITGYSFFETAVREAGLHALDLARKAGLVVAVDPSSDPQLAEVGPQTFLQWTEGADFLFPNLAEGAVLSGQRDPEAIGRVLSQRYGEVVLTMGSRGALWCSAENDTIHVPAPAGPVVDTTGAGDAFAAGFLASRLAGESPPDALAAGSTLAGRVVSRLGARPPEATDIPHPHAL